MLQRRLNFPLLQYFASVGGTPEANFQEKRIPDVEAARSLSLCGNHFFGDIYDKCMDVVGAAGVEGRGNLCSLLELGTWQPAKVWVLVPI